MSDCCCDWRAPSQVRYVAPVVVAGIIAWLHGSFTYYAQPRLLAMNAHWGELLAFHTLTALLISSLAQCLLSQESFVPRRTLRKKFKQLGEDNNDSSDDEAEVVEWKMNGERRVCRKCRALKPDRTHHCSSCKRCVYKMDHHCVYINKCIGYFNYKYFLQFLGWSAATCLYQSTLLFRYVLANNIDQASSLFFFGKLTLFTPCLQIVAVFFCTTCLGAALLCFYLMHLFLTLFNYTTIDYCEKRREPEYVHYYNVGILRNLQLVFGTWSEFPYWFLPLPTPSVYQAKDAGIRFPVNSKFALNKQD